MDNDFLNQLFSYYDKALQPVPISYQVIISVALLVFLLWNIYAFLKSGHWIFILVLVLALPGTWPAVRKLGSFILLLIKGLAYRIQH